MTRTWTVLDTGDVILRTWTDDPSLARVVATVASHYATFTLWRAYEGVTEVHATVDPVHAHSVCALLERWSSCVWD